MKIEHISLHDFKSYRDQEIDLTGVRLASVVGANGAGKSSILDAILFALTGARSLGSLDSFIRQGCEECRVTVPFAIDGTRYRVTRTRSSRGSGKSTVELAREEAGLWVAEGTGARETDQRLSEVLGIDEDMLMHTSIIAQGDAGSFFALRPAQRLDAFGAILKLDDQYGPLERYWKQQADQTKADLQDIRRDIEHLETDVTALAAREEQLALAQMGLKQAQRDLESEQEVVAQARQQAEEAKVAVPDTDDLRRHRDHLEGQLKDLAARRDALTAERKTLMGRIVIKDSLLERQATRTSIEAELACLAEAERADAQTRQQRAGLEADLRAAKEAMLDTSQQGKPKAAEHKRLQEQAADLNDRVCAIRGAELPVCDRCGQPIANEALAQTLAQLEDELENVTRRRDTLLCEVEALREKLAEQKREVDRLEEAIAALPPLAHDLARERHLKGLLEELNEIPAKLATIAAAEERTAAIDLEVSAVTRDIDDQARLEAILEAKKTIEGAEDLREAWRRADAVLKDRERSLEWHRQSMTDAEKNLARHEEAVALLGPKRDELAEARARAKELETDQADAEILRKAFSKWGVPALIVGNVLLALEREVNELLGLYDGGLAVRFESEKETRDGSRGSLEIMVYDGTAWRDFSTFSGGEKYRVASAMRLGLARLLACRSGSRVKTLVLDEPEGLDVEGRQHLVKILERMSADVDLILLLTHYEDLKDAMPSQVVVSRDPDGASHVDVVA